LSVCLSITTVIPAKTTEPMEVPCGIWIPVGPSSYVFDGVQIPPWEGA